MTEYGDFDPLDAVDATDGQPRLMSAIWLDGAATALRDAGLNVIEVDGWQRRSKANNSGYSRVPTHVMVHHTASNTSPANDVNYIVNGAPAKPLANLLIARNGDVYLCAGGPTNTNGEGRDTWGGGVPDNSMNSYAIGIEIANTGVGESYPKAQLDAVRMCCAVACRGLGIPVKHVRSHFEWAPGRKIDPSGAPYDTPATPNLLWDMTVFRRDVEATLNPPDNPPVGDSDVLVLNPPKRVFDSRDGAGAWTAGQTRQVNVQTNKKAVFVNITVVDPQGPGFITAWGAGSRPQPSNLNYLARQTISNSAWVPVVGGQISIYSKAATHVIVDLQATTA
jgi:hypothetical protein